MWNADICLHDTHINSIYKLRYGHYLEMGSEIWFFNQNFNGLLCMGKDDGRIRNIYQDKKTTIRGRFLYSGITCYKRTIILTPLIRSAIALFDLDTKNFRYVDLDKERFLPGTTRSIGYYQEGEYIYILPANMAALIKLNIETLEIQYIDTGIEKKIKISNGFIFRNQFEVVDHKIYVPFVSCGGMAVYDLNKDIFEIKLEGEIKNCSTISYENGRFYIGSWDEKKIYIWNEEKDSVDKYDIEFTTESEKIFNASWIQEGKLVLFPYHASELIVFDIGSFSYIKTKVDVDLSGHMTCLFAKKDNFTAYFSGSNDIRKICCSQERVEIQPWFKADEDYNKHVIAQYLVNNGMFNVIKEKEGYLEEMLSVVKFL